MNVYETCPTLYSGRYLLRQTRMEDRDALLKVYSDIAAVPIFNSDNCTGDFYMTTPEAMENCIRFWLREYALGYYVRWSVLDREAGEVIGTVELFNRGSEDAYNGMGLLRLDLRSDYETETAIPQILNVLLPQAYTLFDCAAIATKIPPCAQVRKKALTAMGFTAGNEPLIGHHGKEFWDYYVLRK